MVTESSPTERSLLGLPQCDPSDADVVILPLPFEGTVSYGLGTARGPEAVLNASEQVELWDDELHFPLESLKFHTSRPFAAHADESPASYLARVQASASAFRDMGAFVIGLGGEHSLTPPLVRAAVGTDDLSELTVVQIDAHTDLRYEYEGSVYSHASAMRRLTEAGAALIAVGIRATSQEEMQYVATNSAIEIYRAQDLANTPGRFDELLRQLRSLTGRIYLTVDIDGLAPSLCPGTGTPEPGGLDWYPTLQVLKSLLLDSQATLVGMDFVETVPMPSTHINEFTTARLIAKSICYASVRNR